MVGARRGSSAVRKKEARWNRDFRGSQMNGIIPGQGVPEGIMGEILVGYPRGAGLDPRDSVDLVSVPGSASAPSTLTLPMAPRNRLPGKGFCALRNWRTEADGR